MTLTLRSSRHVLLKLDELVRGEPSRTRCAVHQYEHSVPGPESWVASCMHVCSIQTTSLCLRAVSSRPRSLFWSCFMNTSRSVSSDRLLGAEVKCCSNERKKLEEETSRRFITPRGRFDIRIHRQTDEVMDFHTWSWPPNPRPSITAVCQVTWCFDEHYYSTSGAKEKRQQTEVEQEGGVTSIIISDN